MSPKLTKLFFRCGGFGEWLWKHVIGLTPTSPAFATLRIEPQIDGFYGPSKASAHFLSPRGEVVIEWNRSVPRVSTFVDAGDNGDISLRVLLPVGIESATIRVPPPFEAPVPAENQVVCATGSELGAKQIAVNSHNSPMASLPKTVYLECSGGGRVNSVDFASYGAPLDTTGECASWNSGSTTCQSQAVVAVIERLCLNQTHCAIAVHNSTFGDDPCPYVVKTFAVRATCSGGVVRNSAEKFVVTERGKTLWDGANVVDGIDGILSAKKVADGLEVQISSGEFIFDSTPAGLS